MFFLGVACVIVLFLIVHFLDEFEKMQKQVMEIEEANMQKTIFYEKHYSLLERENMQLKNFVTRRLQCTNIDTRELAKKIKEKYNEFQQSYEDHTDDFEDYVQQAVMGYKNETRKTQTRKTQRRETPYFKDLKAKIQSRQLPHQD